jgi:hypothetical protein
MTAAPARRFRIPRPPRAGPRQPLRPRRLRSVSRGMSKPPRLSALEGAAPPAAFQARRAPADEAAATAARPQRLSLARTRHRVRTPLAPALAASLSARVECPHAALSQPPDDVSGHISRRRRHPTIRRWLSARRFAHAPQWPALVRPRLTRNPMLESTAFNIATKRPENNFFGCPHHKHVTLATLCGLPHAEQTFTCRIEGFFPGSSKLKRAIGPNVAVKAGGLNPSEPEGHHSRRQCDGFGASAPSFSGCWSPGGGHFEASKPAPVPRLSRNRRRPMAMAPTIFSFKVPCRTGGFCWRISFRDRGYFMKGPQRRQQDPAGLSY